MKMVSKINLTKKDKQRVKDKAYKMMLQSYKRQNKILIKIMGLLERADIDWDYIRGQK